MCNVSCWLAPKKINWISSANLQAILSGKKSLWMTISKSHRFFLPFSVYCKRNFDFDVKYMYFKIFNVFLNLSFHFLNRFSNTVLGCNFNIVLNLPSFLIFFSHFSYNVTFFQHHLLVWINYLYWNNTVLTLHAPCTCSMQKPYYILYFY